MTMNRMLLAAALLAPASFAGAQANIPSGWTNIGVAAAVQGAVRASAPGQRVGRVIGSGRPVYLNDHVVTGPDGRVQLLLLDETTFTIGPNSDLVLDEFVYDPHTGAGKVSAQILKGAFRFVTGQIARVRPSRMKVTLPMGTIGIRGTMVAGRVDGQDADVVLIGPGADNDAHERRGGITITNNYGSSDVDSGGYGVSIRDGGKPSRGYRFSPVELERILSPLSPKVAVGRGGPSNAKKTSGYDLSLGGVNLNRWTALNTLNSSLGQTTTFATQQSASGPDTWNDLLAIPSGVAGYSGNGTFACVGSGCMTALLGYSGTFTFKVNVNFATQTLGGDGASELSVTSGASDTATMNGVSFSGLGGKAVVVLPAAAATGTAGNFGGTTLAFNKVGGQTAGSMQINMVYNATYGGNGTATGVGQSLKGAAIPVP